MKYRPMRYLGGKILEKECEKRGILKEKGRI
jgi:hypothetical protein